MAATNTAGMIAMAVQNWHFVRAAKTGYFDKLGQLPLDWKYLDELA